jgi:predicted phage terminase large subunit-like protein
MRRSMGEYAFAGQYQQNPVPLGGGLVRGHWLKTYEPGDLPERGSEIVQSWDTASKESELSDYSVCTTWLVEEKRLYLLDVLRARMDYPTLKREVVRLAHEFKATVVLIEDKASGIQLIQELTHDDQLPMVRGIKPVGDKLMRMNAQTATIENGFVFLPKEAPWLRDYVAEMTSFPKAKYADQVDSTSQAMAWVIASMYGAGMNVYYMLKREHEEKMR